MTERPEVQAAAAALELERRWEEERLRYYQRPLVHHKQRELHQSPHRFRGALGGNRAGKTIAGAVETALFALGDLAEPYIQGWYPEDQEWWYERFGSMRVRQREQLWAATVNWDVHRDVLQPTLLEWLPESEIEDLAWRRKGVLDWLQTSGRRIVFKSYETGADGFQGASLPFIWLDEEPALALWNECEQRVMDQKGHILLTFTPLKGLTWSHSRLYLNAARDAETFCIHFEWDDNPYLDDREKERLLEQMDPEEAEARVYGRYIVFGQNVFDNLRLTRRRREVEPGIPYQLEGIPHEAMVWEPPQRGELYVIGADVAEGLPSGDNSTACVLKLNGQQVAEFVSNKLEPEQFARLLGQLGGFYNNALLIPERNKDGRVVCNTLLDEGYPALYRHEDDKWGFPTTARTRPVIIAEGQRAVRNAPETIHSPWLIEECLTFIRNDQGRPEAAGKGQRGGKKDDRIFAWLLALHGRNFFGELGDPFRPRRPLENDDYDTVEDWVAGRPRHRPQGKEYAQWDPRKFVRSSSWEPF